MGGVSAGIQGGVQEASRTAPVLRRAGRDRVLAGVAAGLAHYLGIDPVLVRLAWVILTFAAGIEMVILYIAGAILIPEARPGEVTARPSHHSDWGLSRLRVLAGMALVLVGGLMLATELLPVVFDWRAIAAAAMIVVGASIIFRSRSIRWSPEK